MPKNTFVAKRIRGCEDCSERIDLLKGQITKLELEKQDLLELVSTQALKIKSLEDQLDNNNVQAMQAQFQPEHELVNSCDLKVDNFQSYLALLVQKYPILLFILKIVLSTTHWRKTSQKSTGAAWLTWASFYKCFISEMLIRAKSAKLTTRTPLLLGLYFYLTKVPKPAWRLLQRLRIVCSMSKIENWIKEQPIPTCDEEDLLFFSFDNCDFFQHKTSIRTANRSKMLHTTTQFYFKIKSDIQIHVNHIWSKISKEHFMDYMEASFTFCNNLVNLAHASVQSVYLTNWLKFAPSNPQITLNHNDMVILMPLIDCNTSTYAAVELVLERFAQQFIYPSRRTFAFVNSDQPVHNMMWTLRAQNPNKYSWLVPIPGEWHWNWHILKGIYKLYGHYILVPLSQQLGYSNLDVKCSNFHYAEDFLQLVTIALLIWAEDALVLCGHTVLTNLLHSFHKNSRVYEVLYMLIYYLLPYWHTRSALKTGNSMLLTNYWRYWLHLFIGMGKIKYTQLTVRFLWTLSSLHEDILAVYHQNRVFSFSGAESTGIPIDGVNELV